MTALALDHELLDVIPECIVADIALGGVPDPGESQD